MRDQTTSRVGGYAGKKVSAEKIGLLTHLSQGAASGVLAVFALFLVVGLVAAEGGNLLWASHFAGYLLIGGLFGVVPGLILWIAGRVLQRKLGIMMRILLAIGFLSLVPIVICVFTGSGIEWPLLVASLVFGSVVGLPVGIIGGSNIRPGRMLVYGIAANRTTEEALFRNGPIQISRLNEGSKLSFLAGVPLRATSLWALMATTLATVFMLEFFLRDFALTFFLSDFTLSFFVWDLENLENSRDLIEAAFALAYLGITVCVAFTRRKAIALAMAVVVNGPLSAWILKADLPGSDPNFVRTTALVFISFWLLFVGGLIVDNAKKGDLRVEYQPA